MADEKSNGKSDGKEEIGDRKEASVIVETLGSTASSVASSLAGLFLEKQVRKGREIEIPSLGIIIGKENLRGANGSKSPDDKDDSEEKPRTSS